MKRKPLPQSNRQQPCDLCGRNRFEIVATRDRKRRALTTVVCSTCGMVSHERVPTDSELKAYYAVTYRNEYHGEFTPSAHRVLRAWEGGQRLLQILAPQLPADASVFEVGAGIGCTVKSFEQAGYRASGIEPGEGFQAYAKDHIRADVASITLDQVPRQASFDLVLLVHVIEHFSSPKSALQHIRQTLKPGGLLYVECPNIGAPHAAPRKLFHFAHTHNFTPATLEMIGRACGFDVVVFFSKPDSRTHSILFRASENAELKILPNSYQQAIEGIFRYNTLTYHLRPEYLTGRLQRDFRFVTNHILPRLRVQSIFATQRREALDSEDSRAEEPAADSQSRAA